jgi:hypothetical protein
MVYKKTIQEIEAHGYQHGETLAIWFTEYPAHIILPPFVAYSNGGAEWLTSCRRGFNAARERLDKRLAEANLGRTHQETERFCSDDS